MKHSGSFQNSEQKNNEITERYFNALKRQDYSGSQAETENWLYKAGIKLKNQKEERKLRSMKNFILAHKLRLVYSVIALVVIIGACNMPVTQTENLGNMLSWSVPAENSDAICKIDNLNWLKDAQVSKNENTNNGKKEIQYTAILKTVTDEQANNYRKELESLGVTSVKFIPVNQDVKRPLYSAALNNFFSININATGMSDEELQNEVQRQLKEQVEDMKIQFKTGTDGKRDIMIENHCDENLSKDPISYEINIDDNNGQEKIKMMQKKADPDKFKGKTDREIREIVKKDLNNPDLKYNDIKITRENGEVQVKVELNHKEIK